MRTVVFCGSLILLLVLAGLSIGCSGCSSSGGDGTEDVLDAGDVLPDAGEVDTVLADETEKKDETGTKDEKEEESDTPPVDLDVEQDKGEDVQPDAEVVDPCAMPCVENADCVGKFGSGEDVCNVAKCAWNVDCAANLCTLENTPAPVCCTDSDQCTDVDTNPCTINEHCNDSTHSCAYDIDVENPDCQENIVVFAESFDDILVPPGKCVQPPPFKYSDEDKKPDNGVGWCVTDAPLGTKKALYMGNPDTKLYYDGSMWEGKPITQIECTAVNQDVVCPPPLQECDPLYDTCKPEVKPEQIKQRFWLEDLVLPANVMVSLTFRLWVETEETPPDSPYTFDFFEVWVKVNGTPTLLVYDTSKLEDGKTEGTSGIVVSADMSQFAGKAVDIEWKFDSNDGFANEFEGIYVDDIKVATYSKTCTVDTVCGDTSNCTSDKCVPFTNSVEKKGFCQNELFDAFCTECPDGVADCVGSGPFPEDPVCWPATCVEMPDWIKGVSYCQWLPDSNNPQCCNPNYLAAFYGEGFESCSNPTGFTFDDPVNGVGWQVADGVGADFGSNPDTCGLYFGAPAGPVEEWTYECGESLCEGCVSTSYLDLTTVPQQVFVKLSFALAMSTEWDKLANPEEEFVPGTGIDTLTIYATTLGGQDFKVWDSDKVYGTTYGVSIPMWADLTPVVGEKVRLKFCFSTAEVTPPENDYWGVAIDEIGVESVCESVCSVAADCPAAGDCLVSKCEGGACTAEGIPECCTDTFNTECDDGDPCTSDACDTQKQYCIHAPGGDEGCCTPKSGLFAADFSGADLAAVGWTRIESGSCNNDTYCDTEFGETCKSCSADCGECKTVWQVTDHNFYSAPTALYFGDKATWTYQNTGPVGKPLDAWGQVASPAVTLPPYGSAQLSFMLWLETEHCSTCQNFQSPQPYDQLRILVQTAPAAGENPTWNFVMAGGKPAVVWDSVYDWNWNGCTADAQCNATWKKVTVGTGALDLTGKYVRFVFEFASVDIADNAYGGAYVDDLSVSTLCPPLPECHTGFECAEASPDEPQCSVEKCVNSECKMEPNASLPECCTQTTLAGYDFESATCDSEGWADLSQGAPLVKWTLNQSQNHTQPGKCAWYFGNPANMNYEEAGKTVKGTLQGPEVDVTGYEKVQFGFWLWADVVDASYFLDKFWVDVDQVVTPGILLGKPQKIWAKPCSPVDDASECDPVPAPPYCSLWGCETFEMKQWLYYKVDADLDAIMKAAGGGGWISSTHMVVFRIGFDSGDGFENTATGVFIDDVSLSSACQQ